PPRPADRRRGRRVLPGLVSPGRRAAGDPRPPADLLRPGPPPAGRAVRARGRHPRPPGAGAVPPGADAAGVSTGLDFTTEARRTRRKTEEPIEFSFSSSVSSVPPW